MIFNFEDGGTKVMEVGRNCRGIRDRIHGRPISITLDSNELRLISQNPEYMHTLSHSLIPILP